MSAAFGTLAVLAFIAVWGLCIEARAVCRASDRARMERRKAERRRAQALDGRKAVG